MTMMEYIVSPRGILKIIQLVFVVIVLGMWFSLSHAMQDFVSGTVIMALFSSLTLMAQNLLLGPSRVTEVLMSGVQAFFFFVSGILVLVMYNAPVSAACGSFCFFTCIAYGVDVYFAFQIETE
ncbi:uncharacterized protein [Panulirus ornatus]|uniref:uncharacterized protein n=1 Tax=Panulirus ornatus TaxID=150431 RepID=UPI003A89B1E4